MGVPGLAREEFGLERRELGFGEQPRADEETLPGGRLEAEAGPAAGNHIDRQVGVPPVLELAAPHPHVHDVSLAADPADKQLTETADSPMRNSPSG